MRNKSATKSCRDLLLVRLDHGRTLVIGCDSAGAIGSKPLDHIRVSWETLGRFTARVALMEVLSVGANPICLTATLSVEREPAGLKIMKGIREELSYSRLNSHTLILDSTEKNVRTRQTGAGVTAIGTVSSRALRIGLCKRGDEIITVGLPLVGKEVVEGEGKRMIADTRDLRALLSEPSVHEIIPVGSQGIAKEAETLARDSGLRPHFYADVGIDLAKTAGPATVLLCAVPKSRTQTVIKSIRKPTATIGFLK